MINSVQEELIQIINRFADSGWDLIELPSRTWLNDKGDTTTLLTAIKQADKECSSCGCEFDPLYKRAVELLEQGK